MNDFIKNIVNEEINKAIMSGDIILESKKDEKIEIVRRKLKALKNKYKNKGYSDKEALKKAIKKYKEKLKKRKEKELRRRKKRGGGTDVYDYKRYKELNRDVSSGDYKQLTDRIDQEKTDIAAVAREVFPKHTDEGAQSQLRKILNGERPMTNRVAQKLEDMISAGQIAVK